MTGDPHQPWGRSSRVTTRDGIQGCSLGGELILEYVTGVSPGVTWGGGGGSAGPLPHPEAKPGGEGVENPQLQGDY